MNWWRWINNAQLLLWCCIHRIILSLLFKRFRNRVDRPLNSSCCPSVRIQYLENRWTNIHKIWYCGILQDILPFYLQLDNITDITSGFVCISACIASLHPATRHPLRRKQKTSNEDLCIILVNRADDVLTGCRPEVRTFSRNLGTNSKLCAPGKWHEANSILKTHKYYKPLKKFCRPRYLALFICTPLL